MTIRRTWWDAAALLAVPVALIAGWCGNAARAPEFLATARLHVPRGEPRGDDAGDDPLQPTAIERLLAPEALAEAARRLRENGSPLPLAAPFDSEVEHLLQRLEAAPEPEAGGATSIQLAYRTHAEESAVDVLAAVLEAGIESLMRAHPLPADPGAAEREHELGQLGDAVARQQARISELEAEQSELATPQDVARLRVELDQVLERLTSGSRQAHPEGDSLTLVAAVLDESSGGPGDARPAFDRPLAQRWHRELEEKTRVAEDARRIYGRRHPRMIELTTQIDRLRELVAKIPAELQIPSELPASSELDTHSESRWSEVTSSAANEERVARERLATAEAQAASRDELAQRLADERSELDFLDGERSRLREEIAAAARSAEQSRPSISEVPALSDEEIRPPLSRDLAWSLAAGLIVSTGCWRASRRLSRADAPAARPITTQRETLPVDDRQARLRRLKPTATAETA